MNLYQAFCRSVKKFDARLALQQDSEEIIEYTYAQTQRNAIKTAEFVLKRYPGAKRNIAFLMSNTPYSVFSLFGILAAGYTAVPFNPNLKELEIAALLSHSDSPILIYDSLQEEQAKVICDRTDRPVDAVCIQDILKGSVEGLALPKGNTSQTALILYTSGTTGNPKGVMLSHANVYSNFLVFKERIGLRSNQTLFAILPIFHSFGITTILFGGLLVGAKVVLFEKFSPFKTVAAMVRESNVVVAGVPPMLYMITQFAPDSIFALHHLKNVISGGGPLPIEFFDAFKEKFHHEIIEGYGLTETSPVVAQNDNATNKKGTIGRALPGVLVEVRNENGEPLSTGEIGELCIKGPLVMQGYYKNPETAKKAFYDDGWFRSGDLASMDEDGYIKIVGRSKDLIVCGGENIYPREIEEILLQYPGVLEAAVVGKPDALRSELPHAFIVVSEGANVTESNLRNFCRHHLAAFKIPEGFSFIGNMPKTATHKIRKEELKKLYFAD